MIRSVLFALSLALPLMMSGGAADAAQNFESGVNRPGSDYKNFDITPPSGGFVTAEGLCQTACENDASCKAWTFVKAGIQGPKPRCWLKNAIPGKQGNSCCTSGVPMRAFEPGIDRPGKDYKTVDVGADPRSCGQLCQGDNKCNGWTYVKAGVQGPSAKCWLKTTLPDARSDNCCTSGYPDRFVPPK